MAEAYRFGDPVSRAVRYLSGFRLGVVARQEPDNYNKESLLILVTDGGGSGMYSHQLSDARLTFEVRSGNQKQAAEVASMVDALIREWPYREGGVYFRMTLGRPMFRPEPDRRIPAYVWTVNLSFRGELLAL